MTEKLPDVVMTYSQYTELMDQIKSDAFSLEITTRALDKLVEAAQAVVDADQNLEGSDAVYDAIAHLAEKIPCPECLGAPCRCEPEGT